MASISATLWYNDEMDRRQILQKYAIVSSINNNVLTLFQQI
jgi:hypothetical protein